MADVPPEPGDRLDARALRAELGEGLWTSVTMVASTGSTNADLLAAGGREGQVLVAEQQTAGRGRMGRSWVSKPGASLTFSVLLRPDPVPAESRGWLPLLTGVAVAGAIRAASGLPATLKWPNDVLISGGKVAGILAEQADGAVVIGIGINVATRAHALPSGPGGLPGTSLAVEGACIARQRLLTEVLRGLERHYLAFRDNPDPEATGLLGEYLALCATVGQRVRAELPGGRVLTGEATGVDVAGRLLITPPGGIAAPLSAGDVIHLR